MEDKKLQMTLLFDFFGNLLTDRQRKYFDLYHNDDLSLSEIAEIEGITRQGVRDVLVRGENTLLDIEKKTEIIKRFNEIQRDIKTAEKYAIEIQEHMVGSDISLQTNNIIEILHSLKG